MPHLGRRTRPEPGYDARLLRDLQPEGDPSAHARLIASPLFQVACHGSAPLGTDGRRKAHVFPYWRKQPA